MNHSALKFAPECKDGSILPNAIRFGLAAVKNVGEAAMEAAVKERKANGDFKDVDDFAARMESKLINKRMLDGLKKEIIIMHPGPINRGVEISSDAADSGHSIILDQVENGVAIRMAVLYLLSGRKGD